MDLKKVQIKVRNFNHLICRLIVPQEKPEEIVEVASGSPLPGMRVNLNNLDFITVEMAPNKCFCK